MCTESHMLCEIDPTQAGPSVSQTLALAIKPSDVIMLAFATLQHQC